MNLTLILDVIMIALLVMTIGYALRLHRELGRLRLAKDEMAAFAKRFDESYARAEAGIARLKQADAEIMAPLRREIDRAQALRDELAFLGSRSRPNAGAAATEAVKARPAFNSPVNPSGNSTGNNRVGSATAKPAADRLGAAGSPSTSPRPAIRAVGGGGATGKGASTDAAPRSLVERELLEAIRAAGGGRG